MSTATASGGAPARLDPRPQPVVVPPAVAPPPGHPRFPLVDSLRAIAALAVLLSHAIFISAGQPGHFAWWSPAFTNGVQGVTVFFVISGFLLYRPFVNAQLNQASRARLRDYFRRRLLRIVPAYWLALTVLAIYPGLAGVFTHDWWRYYFLLSGYSHTTLLQGLLVSWSLAVEVTFYLALPFYAMLIERLTRGLELKRRLWFEFAVLALLALASTLLRYIDYSTGAIAAIENSLPAFLYWFALGMGLALVSVALQNGLQSRTADLIGARPWLCWAAALAAYLSLCLIENPDGTYSIAQWVLGYYLLGGVMALLLVVPAVLGQTAGGWPRRVLAWPVLGWLGLISYGIYLWHVPVIVDLFDHGEHAFLPLAVAAGVLVVVCAATSYYLVERPVLRFK